MKRSKGKIEVHYGIADFYKYYTSKTTNPVSKQLFNSIISEINENIGKAVIEEAYEFKFPTLRLYLSVCKKKSKIRLDENGEPILKWLPIDYKATKELWNKLYPDLTEEEIIKIEDRPRVYQRNKHTYGYVYKPFLDKSTSNCTNKSVYYFKFSRANSRLLAKYIKSEDFVDNYYEI